MLDAASAVPYLSTFVAAVQAANLTEVFGSNFTGTVVAPQDGGFANLTTLLGLASPSDLLAPDEAAQRRLLQLLQFHVIPGSPPILPESLTSGQKLPTLLGAGEAITVDRSKRPITHLVGGTPLNVVTLLGSQRVGGGAGGPKAVVLVTDQVLVPRALINTEPKLASVFIPALGLGRR